MKEVIYGTDGWADEAHTKVMISARYADFVNIQESPIGFGETKEQALEDLKKQRA